MNLAITQPTFLPWAGYFGLIDQVDEIVFLDDVQFEKRSWQSRNKIKFQDKGLYLTVPVIVKNKRLQKINEVQIDQSRNYISKHLSTIKFSYSKSPFFNHYYDDIKKIYNLDFKYLIDLNMRFIKLFITLLNLNSKISFSSDLAITKKKEFLIESICIKKKCSNYISTIGSKNYLNKLQNNNVKINYFDFKNQKYFQIGSNFIEQLSIMDLLFNLGPDSLKYIRKNFYIL